MEKKREQIQTVLSPDEAWHIIAIPEREKEWVKLHVNAWRYKAVLVELDNFLRQQTKYGLDKDLKCIKKKEDLLVYIRQKLFEFCDGYDVEIP